MLLYNDRTRESCTALKILSYINHVSVQWDIHENLVFLVVHCRIYIYITRALSGQHSDPCALSALEPFFGHFSAARPRLVARLAPSDSPRSRGPCPRAGPPLAAAVAQR